MINFFTKNSFFRLQMLTKKDTIRRYKHRINHLPILEDNQYLLLKTSGREKIKTLASEDQTMNWIFWTLITIALSIHAVTLRFPSPTSTITKVSINFLARTMIVKKMKTTPWKRTWFRTQKHTKTTESQLHSISAKQKSNTYLSSSKICMKTVVCSCNLIRRAKEA